MFNLIKKNKEEVESPLTKITALLIHAAKIDENYTEKEKQIIKKAVRNWITGKTKRKKWGKITQKRNPGP